MAQSVEKENWKERVKREREEQILDIAYRHVLEHGYHGLNLRKVAEEVGCSNGTVFTHFATKEDVLLALTVRTMRLRGELFEQASRFQGTTRERLFAIGVADVLFVQSNPGHFKIETIVKTDSLWERATEERRNWLEQQETHCLNVVNQIIIEAVEAGDLELRGRTPTEICFAFWSMSFGVHSLAADAVSLAHAGIHDPYGSLRENLHVLADGFGWRALSADWNYDATYRRISKEVFPHASFPS